MTTPKPFWKSKTFWINALVILSLLFAAPEIQDLIGLDVAAGLIALINLILRGLTDTPISLTTPQQEE